MPAPVLVPVLVSVLVPVKPGQTLPPVAVFAVFTRAIMVYLADVPMMSFHPRHRFPANPTVTTGADDQTFPDR